MNECKLVNRKADGMPPLGNEYFDNVPQGRKKVGEWVGYIFPIPLPIALSVSPDDSVGLNFEAVLGKKLQHSTFLAKTCPESWENRKILLVIN